MIEYSNKTRSLLIVSLRSFVHLIEQLTGDKKGHVDHARMSNPGGYMRVFIERGGPSERRFN